LAADPPLIAIDTNLLIYAHRAAVPEHGAARRALERAATDAVGWGITLASVAEFWSVVTHPAVAGRASTPREATAFLYALTKAGACLWQPGPGFANRLLETATQRDVRGARVFDLYIALTAVEAGAREIWTHDSDFVSVPGLRVRDPLD
jgi:toxin-antitoxin system PIN domain toxin